MKLDCSGGLCIITVAVNSVDGDRVATGNVDLCVSQSEIALKSRMLFTEDSEAWRAKNISRLL